MKKLLAILVALVLVACFATACANTNEPVVNPEDDIEAPADDEVVADDEVAEDETPVVDETPADEEVVEDEFVEEEAPVVDETPADEEVVEDEFVEEDEFDIPVSELEGIMAAVLEIEAPEFMIGSIPVDLTDLDGLKYFTGLSSADKISEAVVCEAMMGSQAYSMVFVKVNDAADAKAVAEEMKSGIDQRKWICVEADDMKVSAKDDVVMLIMVDSEYAEVISAASVTEAFKTVCGGALDFEI